MRKDQVDIWFLNFYFSPHFAGFYTFEFERKRNRPERYDSNVTEKTLKAIKTIDTVRSRREAKHIERM